MIPQNLRTGTAKEIISRWQQSPSKREAKARERETERKRERRGPEEGIQQDVRVRPFGIVCAPELWENLHTWKRRRTTTPLSRFSVAPFYEYSVALIAQDFEKIARARISRKSWMLIN